jgi:hypothetical protein
MTVTIVERNPAGANKPHVRREVPAEKPKGGLAVTWKQHGDVPETRLYAVTHVQSGMALVKTFSRANARRALREFLTLGIDWASDAHEIWNGMTQEQRATAHAICKACL